MSISQFQARKRPTCDGHFEVIPDVMLNSYLGTVPRVSLGCALDAYILLPCQTERGGMNIEPRAAPDSLV